MMRLISLSGAESVVHPEFGETSHEDGVFEVSDEFGAALLGDAANWTEESKHLAALAQAELEALTDPANVLAILKDLRERVADLQEEVDTLKGEKAKADERRPQNDKKSSKS